MLILLFVFIGGANNDFTVGGIGLLRGDILLRVYDRTRSSRFLDGIRRFGTELHVIQGVKKVCLSVYKLMHDCCRYVTRNFLDIITLDCYRRRTLTVLRTTMPCYDKRAITGYFLLSNQCRTIATTIELIRRFLFHDKCNLFWRGKDLSVLIDTFATFFTSNRSHHLFKLPKPVHLWRSVFGKTMSD